MFTKKQKTQMVKFKKTKNILIKLEKQFEKLRSKEIINK